MGERAGNAAIVGLIMATASGSILAFLFGRSGVPFAMPYVSYWAGASLFCGVVGGASAYFFGEV